MKNKTIAIITGASSGLGREFVQILTARPELDEIWAIARNEQKLQALVSEFQEIFLTGNRSRHLPIHLPMQMYLSNT